MLQTCLLGVSHSGICSFSMNDQIERRRFVRVNVNESHTARLQIGEKTFSSLIVTNLSAGGCCVRVPASLADELDKGTLIHMLYLVHPRIPSVPLQASVNWLLGKQPGRSEGFVLVGLEFIDPVPHYQETLDTYVKSLLG
jgi:c-di-GMP-binding flagellar brake protein YcgR